MKNQLKSLFVKIKYHTWRLTKALEIALRANSETHKQYINELRSKDLMKRTLAHLDRLPKHIPQPSDYHADWFVGTIPHDWERENRIEERIKEKENNDAVD